MDVVPGKSLEVVAVVRPFVPECEEWNAKSALNVIGSQIQVEASAESTRGGAAECSESFSFDRCFNGDAVSSMANDPAGSDASLHVSAIRARCEEQLFWEQSSCWRDAIKKHEDACVIAYGQQRSGKSYTLLGGPDKPGLLHRVADDLLNLQVPDVQLHFSALDLTPDEELRDMLCASPNASGSTSSGRSSPTPSLAVVEHPALGVYIAGLSEVACNSVQTVQELVRHCQRERAASATSIGSNPHTHSLYVLRMQCGGSSPSKAIANDISSTQPSGAQYLFADLVASDSAPLVGADGLGVSVPGGEIARRAAGARPLNGGLSALHHAVQAFTEGKRYVATSKLTQLLGGGLSGNMWMTFLATLSPAWSNLEETRRTLRFSAAVGRLPAASSVAEQFRTMRQERLVERLQEQVQQLRMQLANDLDQMHGEVLTRTIASWEWVLERHAPYGRLGDALALRELEAAQRRRGMLTSSSSANVDGVPYLSNLSSDAQLRGVLIFPLRSPPAHTGLATIGSHSDCSIVLCGVGIPPRLCEIAVGVGDEVTLRTMQQSSWRLPCRCTINGGLVARGSEAKVEHGDRLIFGWAHAFQLCAPDRAERLGLANASCFLTEEDALCELNPDESDTYSVLSLYIEDIREKMSEDIVAKFLEILKEACYYVDEANEIMREMRPDLEQKFDVDFVWDIFRRVQDVIVIRVVQRTNFDDTDSDSMVLFYWTFPKFCERLVAMRAVYNTFRHDAKWDMANNPFEDPWMEASLLEFKEKLNLEQATLLEFKEKLDVDKAIVKPEVHAVDLAFSGRLGTRPMVATSDTIADPYEEAQRNNTMADTIARETLSSSNRSGSSPSIVQDPVSARGGRTGSVNRLSNKVGVGRGKNTAGSMGLRNDQRRVGVGGGSTTGGSLRGVTGADGAGGPSIPILDTEKGDQHTSDRPTLSARREVDRSSSPVEVQGGRHSPGHGSVQMGLEIERLKREAQRHTGEIRRLRADAQQNEKQKKLQDQLIESLRSQLEDKTELVSTLRVIVQDRTAKCDELVKAEASRCEVQASNGKIESLQSTVASGSFHPPMSKTEMMQSSCSSLPTSLPTQNSLGTGVEEVTPPATIPSPISAPFALPGAGTAPSAVNTGCVPTPVAWSNISTGSNFSPRSGSLKGKLKAFANERQPLSPTEEVSRMLESPTSPRPAGSPIAVHTIDNVSLREPPAYSLREPPAYKGCSLTAPPSSGSVPLVAREGGRTVSPSQQQELIRVASPTMTNIARYRSPTPTQSQVYRPPLTRLPGTEQKPWTARVVAPVPISRNTPPRTSVGSNSTPRLASPKAMPVRAAAWSTAVGTSTPPRSEVQERVLFPRGTSSSQQL